MATIKFDGMVSKEDRAWVRSFLKPYDTKGLTIIFTEDWRQRVFSCRTFKKRAISRSHTGVYWPKRNHGVLFGIGKRRNLSFPLIAVNLKMPLWKRTFLHEFGHYLDDMTSDGLKKYQRGKEATAETFAEAEFSKITFKGEVIDNGKTN